MTGMGLAVSKHEAFWEACGFGHTEKVRKFIEGGIDVNWKSYSHSYTCIHVASQGKPEIVHMLIAANCNVNMLDDSGNLAMHHAAMRGHSDIMQMLIDAGSKIDIQNSNGWTPLINAAYWCQPAAIEVLIKQHCDVQLRNKDERMALHEACRSQSEAEGDLAKVTQLLVDAGSDVNSKASDAGEADFTPLIFAAYHGHPEVAKVLINAHCDLNTQTSNEWTALHWAADRGHVKVVAALVEAGASTQMKGRRGELAVDRAKNDAIRKMLQTTTASAPKCQHDEPVARVRSPNSGSSGLGDGTLRKSPNNTTMTSSEFVKFLLGPAAPPNGPTRNRVSRMIDRPAEPTVPPPEERSGGMCLDDVPCIDDGSDEDEPQQMDTVTNEAHGQQLMTETADNTIDQSKTGVLPTIDELAKEMDCINCNTVSDQTVPETTVIPQPSVLSVASDKTSSEVGFELHATDSQTDLKNNCDAAATSASNLSRPVDMSDDDLEEEEVVNQWRSDVDLVEYQKEASAAAASANGDKGFALHATNSQTNLVDNARSDQAVSDMSLEAGKKGNDIDASGAASETGVEVQRTKQQCPEAASGGCSADAQ